MHHNIILRENGIFKSAKMDWILPGAFLNARLVSIGIGAIVRL